VDSILAERGDVEIVCDFCSARYAFDAVDVAQLYSSGATETPDASTRH
jgi:molecular chaperone Hsp33